MKKILLILMILMILPFVTATIYKQGTEIDLKIPCVNSSGALCSDVTSCNITVYYPNGTVIINGANMSRVGTYFNYTFTSEQTQEVGEYNAFVLCHNLEYGYTSFTYMITPQGGIINQGGTSWDIVLIIAFLGIAGLMFYLSTTFKSDPFKTLFIMFGMGSILLSIQFTRILVENSAIALSDDIVNLIMPLFIFAIVTFSLLIAYLFILLMVKTIKMLKGKGR